MALTYMQAFYKILTWVRDTGFKSFAATFERDDLPARLDYLLAKLVEAGYVKGFPCYTDWYGRKRVCLEYEYCPTITLAGLEYLEENTSMQKARRHFEDVELYNRLQEEGKL